MYLQDACRSLLLLYNKSMALSHRISRLISISHISMYVSLFYHTRCTKYQSHHHFGTFISSSPPLHPPTAVVAVRYVPSASKVEQVVRVREVLCSAVFCAKLVCILTSKSIVWCVGVASKIAHSGRRLWCEHKIHRYRAETRSTQIDDESSSSIKVARPQGIVKKIKTRWY